MLINFRKLSFAKVEICKGTNAVFNLFRSARANQRRSQARVTQDPGDCHLRERLAAALGNEVEGPYARDRLVIDEIGQQ